MNKANTNKHAKLQVEKSMRSQPYAKNCRQMNKAGSRRGDPPQRRACQLLFQYQMANPENIRTHDNKKTEQGILKNIIYIYILAITVNEKETFNFKERNQGCMGQFAGNKGRGDGYNCVIISKIKK